MAAGLLLVRARTGRVGDSPPLKVMQAKSLLGRECAVSDSGLTLPKVPKGDQVWQHSDAVQQRVDADGNWLRKTDGKIQDQTIEREVDAMTNAERFQSHTRTVDAHSTESVGGVKKIEALGALKLLSGVSASLAAGDDLQQATGRDLNQKHNATVGGDMYERIEGYRESVAGVSQCLQAPKRGLALGE